MNNIPAAIISVNVRESGDGRSSCLLFSHAEVLSTRVDSRWLYYKDKGNEALQAKDPLTAARFYLEGLVIAKLDAVQAMEALRKACKNPKKTIYKVLHSLDIFCNILEFLWHDDPPTEQPGKRIKFDGKTFYVPNLPAAVCHSNAAAAFLTLAGSRPLSSSTEVEPGPETEADRKFFGRGNHCQSWAELAELHAKCATIVCGEYEKGHVRLKCCYERLGKVKEAKEEARRIAQFKQLQYNKSALPTMCHLFLVGWINQFTLSLFMIRRLKWLLHRMTDENDSLYIPESTFIVLPGKRFEVMFSMVPFSGGQFFTGTIVLPHGQQVYSSYFQACFPSHDLDLELPPNGIIHPQVTHLRLTTPPSSFTISSHAVCYSNAIQTHYLTCTLFILVLLQKYNYLSRSMQYFHHFITFNFFIS